MRLVALLGLALVATNSLAQEPALAQRLEALMDGPDYVSAQWGVLVVDSKTGEVIYSREAEKLFTPASTTKLYSTTGMMLAYGMDHRFRTPLYVVGETNKGIVRGQLVMVSQGDPMFGSRFGPHGEVLFRDNDHTYSNGVSTDYQLTDTDPRFAFDDLAKQVKAAGIKSVDGEVLIDDRLFVPTRSTGSGPGSVTPVIINDNVIDLLVKPGQKVGDPAQVTVRPETSFLRSDISLTTGSAKSSTLINVLSSEPDRLVVRGNVALGSKPIVRIVPIEDSTALARVMLIEALRRQGITVSASTLLKPTEALPAKSAYKELKPVATHTSAPVKDLLKVTLKVSHNLYATTLPLLVGAKSGVRTQAQGLQEEGRLLKTLGVPIERISFGGGAGGSNADKVTPAATVTLLRALQQRPEWADYKDCLPILGVDGTLASVVPASSPAKGQVFAKTGTLYWTNSLSGGSVLTSKALAGVMTTQAGRELTFAMFVNDVPLPPSVPTSREGKLLGQLAELIYLHTPAAK